MAWPALCGARALAGSASTTGALLVTSGPGQCLSLDFNLCYTSVSLSTMANLIELALLSIGSSQMDNTILLRTCCIPIIFFIICLQSLDSFYFLTIFFFIYLFIFQAAILEFDLDWCQPHGKFIWIGYVNFIYYLNSSSWPVVWPSELMVLFYEASR